ncbi:hypothetical protein GCM10027200_58740 [Lentzea nigeriaca]
MDAGDPGGNTVGDVHGDITQIRDPHGDVRPARQWLRVAGVLAGALIVVVVASIVWRGQNRPEPGTGRARTSPGAEDEDHRAVRPPGRARQR